MNLVAVALVALPAGLVIAAEFLLLRQLSSKRSRLPVATGWTGELSSDRYGAMRCPPAEGDTPLLRAQRCRIFRQYLACLDRDFNRTCTALKMIMLQSHCDRRDLAATLLKSQVRFLWSTVAVRFLVVRYRCGLTRWTCPQF